MKPLFLLVLVVFCFSDAVFINPQHERRSKRSSEVMPTPRVGETIEFFDNFTNFDLSVWQHELTMSGEGNWEFEYYTNNRSNSYVSEGILYLQPTLTNNTIGDANLQNGYTMSLWGGTPADLCTSNADYGCERTSGAGGNILNPIQSARIRSVNSFSFQYGRVEVRAKLPLGDWIWPAIWMLPTYDSYGSWPASGEIDIVESRGNQDYSAGGVNQFGSTLHWGPFYPYDQWPMTHEEYALPSGDFSQEFHVYGLVWTNDTIYTYLDNEDQIVLKVPIDQSFWELGDFPAVDNPWEGRGDNAPFDQEFYLIFNVAVGGTGGYFPDGVGGKPWTDSSPNAVNEFWDAVDSWYPTWEGVDSALQIDWVTVSSFNE